MGEEVGSRRVKCGGWRRTEKDEATQGGRIAHKSDPVIKTDIEKIIEEECRVA